MLRNSGIDGLLGRRSMWERIVTYYITFLCKLVWIVGGDNILRRTKVILSVVCKIY